MERDLKFFSFICNDRSHPEKEKMGCTIEHAVKNYKKGDYIAYQGDRIAFFYMLTQGRVKTEMVSDSGLTMSIEELVAPYPLAAAFLFADNNRFPVDVIALEDCEVLLISRESIEKQMIKCKGFLRGFLAFGANRTQFLSERLRIFSQKGIKAKIAYYILQREKGGYFELGKSIAALADYFAVERPSLSRAISEIGREGIIEFEDGKGKILNYNGMKELLG